MGSLARGLCGCIRLFHCEAVTITEDSTIFRALLSFIYPDKEPTMFKNLTSLIPVLDAAAKYDMKGVVRSLCLQLMKGTMGDTLMYEDPLWVYSKAKQLGLTDLKRAAAKATLTINLSEAQCRPDVANAPASWILELFTLRKEHIEWWKRRYNMPTSIIEDTNRHPRCQCYSIHLVDVVLKIMERPCARSVREIEFYGILHCHRCSEAVTAYYQKQCLLYEQSFGKF